MGEIRLDGAGASRGRLEAMAGAIHHRGPDDEGFWVDQAIGLGHRRLSIIDLSGSHQPMQGVDGRWTIVFNGEILNYRELRAALDYPFRTDGDTETILAGLTVHGISFIEKMVGQFAFAAYDSATGTTHLVRDRLGILPLYYRQTADSFLFGSEIKAILAGMEQKPDVDVESLDAYLFGRSVPAPYTLFAGIRKLPAAHLAELRADGRFVTHRYWSPPTEEARTWSAGDAVDAVDEAVTRAVRSALVADVPVGAYLSGGVDSSLIVQKAAALHSGGRLKTFAAGFGDPRYDELPFARQVSKHVGSDHHEVHVDARDFEALWPTLTWHRDAPMSQPADFAVYRLAQAAREHVTVVLSGEGGDELFAGYPKYEAANAMALASIIPGGLRRGLAGAVDGVLPSKLSRARIGLRVWGAGDRDAQFRTWFAPFTERERSQLLNGVATRSTSLADASDGKDPIRAMLLADLRNWLPDNLLERGDRMSMATSLELRPPLLDHRLVELAFRLPSDVKVRSGQTKWVLKEVARRNLPPEIVDRKKVGFRVPLDAWFRSSLRDSVRDRLTGSGSFVAETMDRKAVRELLDRHDSGRFNEEASIWTLMSLEVWHETFFSG
ncbi:asparagine synthase (glutamine-hydrolyzing) [Microbacterium yannicii]|uniref:asparagine synthase (glutamine-hydrolyzing) n=1 Tax=Microbacterium yannicii TaxID=671622 RepID=UPI0020925245|nr:asparagine synthase (glutamine-hydrolyzing) [Microbacterium yannicii]MCO5952331.1 asparagine synthase (glutamine-hydrolyzing) [Microbacterium yannicii]